MKNKGGTRVGRFRGSPMKPRRGAQEEIDRVHRERGREGKDRERRRSLRYIQKATFSSRPPSPPVRVSTRGWKKTDGQPAAEQRQG